MPRCFVSPPRQLMLLAVAATLGLGSEVLAQSSTRSTYTQPTTRSTYQAPIQSGTTIQSGSTTRSTIQAATTSQVAMEGYCPVCVVEMKKWVRGNPSIQTVYDGKTYYFPGEDQRSMFLSAPDKYIPALGGDCVVCQADMGARSAGSVRHSAISRKRLYLFPNEEMKLKFASDPLRYVNADVALNGNCAVCRVEMNQDVAGNPDLFVRHGGMKYLFPSEDQRKMFLANPSKYTVGKAPAAGSRTR